MQAASSADTSKVVSYTPNGADGKLIGSDFTSFFLTSASDPTISGMRLTPVSLGSMLINLGFLHSGVLAIPGYLLFKRRCMSCQYCRDISTCMSHFALFHIVCKQKYVTAAEAEALS